MSQVWLIADRPEAVIQSGQPPAQQAAWLLDIPAGSNALNTAAVFASSQGFPSDTVARVIDLSVSPITISTFKLTASWVAQ